MGKINYATKEQATVNQQPAEKKWSFGDANEVKTVVNENFHEGTEWDNSENKFPDAGGTGSSGQIRKYDFFTSTGTGNWEVYVGAGSTQVKPGTIFVALIDEPTNDPADWNVIPREVVTKEYVDALALGLVTSWKAPVKVASTGNLTLSGEQTIDGVLTSASRVLVKDQSTAAQNGIYVSGSGAWTRASDANAGTELEGAAVTVQEGTSNTDTTWLQTADAVNLGVTNIAWTQLGAQVPDADASTKGKAKLYTTTDGNNSDGAVSQAAINSKFRATRTITANDSAVQTDDNKLLIFNSATPVNFTLDALTADTKIFILNFGAGAVNFLNGSGVTKVGADQLRGSVGNDFPGCTVEYFTGTAPRVIQGVNEIDCAIVDTSVDPIVLDCNNQPHRMFVGNESFAGAKTISVINDDNTLVINVKFVLTNVAAVTTWPGDFQAVTADGRWSNGAKTFTPPTGQTGKYEFSATYDPQNETYDLKATNPYP